MNVFSEIFASMAGTKHYPDFLNNRKGKIFLYGFLVATIVFILANVRICIEVNDLYKEFKNEVLNEIPDFDIKNGKLDIEEPVKFEEDGVYVLIDSKLNQVGVLSEDEWNKKLSSYDAAFVADATGMVSKSDGKVQVMNYPENLNFAKKDIDNFVPKIPGIIAVVFVFIYIGTVISYFFKALILALIGLIIASVMKSSLRFGRIYVIALYGRTLSAILKAVFTLVGVNRIPEVGGILSSMLSFILFVVAVLYVGFAIKRCDVEGYGEDFNFG